MYRPRGRSDGRRRTPRSSAARFGIEVLEARNLLAASLSVGPNVNVSAATDNQAQPAIAVNPADPQNLVVAANEVGGTGVLVSVSTDAGKTWRSRVAADGSDGLVQGSGDVSVAFDAFGDAFLAYLDSTRSKAAVALSIDGGQTFSPLTTIDGVRDQPQLAVGSGGATSPQAVWVAYHASDGRIALTGAPIQDGGSVGAFLAPEEVSGSAGGDFPRPSVGPNGQVLIAYENPVNDLGPSEIFTGLEPDGLGPAPMNAGLLVTAVNIGGSAPVPPQPVKHIDTEAVIAYDTSGLAHNGRVYLIKTDTQPVGNTQTAIFVEFSDDDGKTWSEDVFADDSDHVSTLILPRIAVDPTTGVVAVSWLDTRKDKGSGPDDTDGKPLTDVEAFGSISLDGGQTFLPNVQIAGGPSNAIKSGGGTDDHGFDYGGYTGLAFFNNTFYAAWPDNSAKLSGNPDAPNLDIATAAVIVVGGPPPVEVLNVRPVTFNANEGQSFSDTVATFTTTDPTAQPSSFIASINWGDGSTSAGTVARATSGGFLVNGTHTYMEGGTYSVRVVVTPQGKPPGSTKSTAIVADAPLIGTPASLTADEGTLFTGVVATFTDTDLKPTDPSVYQATIDWGDGTTSQGAVSAQPGGGFAVTGAHTLGGGTQSIHITITDAGGAKTTVASQVVVNDSPLVAQGVPITGVEGQILTGTVATFHDEDPRFLTPAYYSATIDWGDGTTTAGTISVDNSGTYSVAGTHTYRIGSFPIHVTIHDADVSQTTADSTAAITDAPVTPHPLTITATEGVAFNGIIATFSDDDPLSRSSTFSAAVDWGDGTTSPARVNYEGDHQFTVLGSHAFSAGSHTFSVTVSEVGHPEATFTITGTANVASSPITVVGSKVANSVEGVPFSAVVAAFSDPNPFSKTGDHTATILWGDGTASAGTITGGAGSFRVTGSHTYAMQGTYSAVVQVKNSSGDIVQTSTAIKVGDAPLTATGSTITTTEKTSFRGVVASFTDANPHGQPGDETATIDWGDGTRSPGIITAAAGRLFVVTGTHTYQQGGDHALMITLVSQGGGVTTAFGVVHVRDIMVPVTGTLSPLSDSGVSHADGITNVIQPSFVGTALPGSIVRILAAPAGLGGATAIGQGVADALGRWAITVMPLPDGIYTILATATNAAGRPDSPIVPLLPSPVRGPLIIDTAGPRVAATVLDPTRAQLRVTFLDDAPNLSPASLANPRGFTLLQLSSTAIQPLPLTGLVVVPSSPSNVATVIATFNQGRPLAAGRYVVDLASIGLTDLAGNPLVERFFVPFPPTSLSVPDFVAEFDTNGRTTASPVLFLPQSEQNAARQHERNIRGRVRTH